MSKGRFEIVDEWDIEVAIDVRSSGGSNKDKTQKGVGICVCVLSEPKELE